MRDEVLRKLGLPGASDPPSTDLDRAMNRIWRWMIPNRVGNACAHGYVTIATVVGQESYDLDVLQPGLVRAVRAPIHIGVLSAPQTERLVYYTTPDEFWEEFDVVDTAQAKPWAVLVEDRALTLRPRPDGIYFVRAAALLYRAALASTGVADEIEAKAVVDGAVQAIAHDLGMENIAQRHGALFEAGLDELSLKYTATISQDPVVVQPF